MKGKKLDKLKRMQVHIIRRYDQGEYGEERVTEIAFPRAWNKSLIKRWLNNNGYEEFYDNTFLYEGYFRYALDWKFRKNRAYVVEYYNV